MHEVMVTLKWKPLVTLLVLVTHNIAHFYYDSDYLVSERGASQTVVTPGSSGLIGKGLPWSALWVGELSPVP